MLQLTELSIVVLYMLFCVGVGMYYRKRAQENVKNYYSAGGSLGMVVSIVATFAAWSSGGTMIGGASTGYSLGLTFIWSAVFGAVIGYVISARMIAPQIRKYDQINTIVDYFKVRYPQSKFLWGASTVIIALAYALYIASQYKAGGMSVEYTLGIPYEWSLIIIAVVFILYVSMGGMWAVTMTDFIQGLLMLIMSPLLAIVILVYYGGPADLLNAALEVQPNWSQQMLPPVSTIGFMLIWLTMVLCAPHLIIRLFSTRDSNVARSTMIYTGLLFGIFAILTYFTVAAAGKIMFPPDQKLADADLLYFKVLDMHFPPILRGFALAAVLAAVMSTCSALLIACAAAIGNDLLPIIKPGASEKQKVNVGIWTTIIVGVFATIIALDPPKLLVVLFSEATGFMVAGLLFPFILGLWWKGFTGAGAITSLIIGSGGYGFIALLTNLKLVTLPVFSGYLIVLPVAGIAGIIVSLMTKSQAVTHVQSEAQ